MNTSQNRYSINQSTHRSSFKKYAQNQDQEDKQFIQQSSRYERPHISHRNTIIQRPSLNSNATKYIGNGMISQKKNTLNKYRYINQLARLQYDEKEEQIYTKYTRLSKASVMKKIKARNQIAQFEDQQENQNIGYDQLIEFKFGKDKNKDFFFQKQQITEFNFCEFCDTIHNDHPEVHIRICEKVRAEDPQSYSPYSNAYNRQSLKRIRCALGKIRDQQYEEIWSLMGQIESQDQYKNGNDKRSTMKKIFQIKQKCCDDTILIKIIQKVAKLIEAK